MPWCHPCAGIRFKMLWTKKRRWEFQKGFDKCVPLVW